MIQAVVAPAMDLDDQAYEPVQVFLNGEYWGIHNLREKVNEHWVTSNYGIPVEFVTLLPENDIGNCALMTLRKHNVGTKHIISGGDRLGIYFLETGAVSRASKVIYDRSNSAISQIEPGIIKWKEVFRDAGWFHWTGITPAISQGAADVCLEAVQTANKLGLTVSCDLNYRKKLWQWGKTPVEVMPEFVNLVDVLIGNEEDCQKCLGIEAEVDVDSGELELETYRQLATKVFAAFPNLKYLAVSLRESLSADFNRWSGTIATPGSFLVSSKYDIRNIVDRIGGGDSFAAGLIRGIRRGDDLQETLEFAVAAAGEQPTGQEQGIR